jgi:hypothetical protein
MLPRLANIFPQNLFIDGKIDHFRAFSVFNEHFGYISVNIHPQWRIGKRKRRRHKERSTSVRATKSRSAKRGGNPLKNHPLCAGKSGSKLNKKTDKNPRPHLDFFR